MLWAWEQNCLQAVTECPTLLSTFPIVGNALGGFVGYLDGQVDTFRSLSEVGASFGNNIVEMNLAVLNAGLSMDQFAESVGQNSDKMLLLGGTVTEGAKQFGQITRQIRNSNKDFMGMGFMEALNEHTAEYMDPNGKARQIVWNESTYQSRASPSILNAD